jgi:hypothetical protein
MFGHDHVLLIPPADQDSSGQNNFDLV